MIGSRSIIFILTTIGVLFGVLLFVFRAPAQPQTSPTNRLMIAGTEIIVEIADTIPERILGLSGRVELPEQYGLLFVFDTNDYHAIWMKDMQFPIDVIWLDEQLRIVDIKKDFTPQSYPEIASPKQPARFVLEVPAGFSTANGFVEGMEAVLKK